MKPKTKQAQRIARSDRWLKRQKDEMGNPWKVIDAASAFLKHLPGHDLQGVYNQTWKWMKRGVVPQLNYRTLLAPHFVDCPLFK